MAEHRDRCPALTSGACASKHGWHADMRRHLGAGKKGSFGLIFRGLWQAARAENRQKKAQQEIRKNNVYLVTSVDYSNLIPSTRSARIKQPLQIELLELAASTNPSVALPVSGSASMSKADTPQPSHDVQSTWGIFPSPLYRQVRRSLPLPRGACRQSGPPIAAPPRPGAHTLLSRGGRFLGALPASSLMLLPSTPADAPQLRAPAPYRLRTQRSGDRKSAQASHGSALRTGARCGG